MEDNATQRGGLVFVYNMYGSKYANFDYDLSQKMLTLLKDSGRKSAADCLPPPPPPPEDEDIHEEDNHEGPNANNLVTSTSNKSNSASRLSNSSGMLVAS